MLRKAPSGFKKRFVKNLKKEKGRVEERYEALRQELGRRGVQHRILNDFEEVRMFLREKIDGHEEGIGKFL